MGAVVEGAAHRRDAPFEALVEVAGSIPHDRIVDLDQALQDLRPIHVELEGVRQEAHPLPVALDRGPECGRKVGRVRIRDDRIGFQAGSFVGGHGAPRSRCLAGRSPVADHPT